MKNRVIIVGVSTMKLVCFVASIIWGLNVVFMKSVLQQVPFLQLAFWRVILSSIVLFVIGQGRHLSFRIDRSTGRTLCWIGLLNVALNFSLSFYAMKLVSGQNVALLNALIPVMTSFIQWRQTKIKPNQVTILSLIFTLIGVLVGVYPLQIGHGLLCLSTFCYGLSFILANKLTLHAIILSFYTMLFGGLQLGIMMLLFQEAEFLNLTLWQWLGFLFFSVLGFAFIQTVYFQAKKEIGMHQTAFYMNLNPIFTYLGSFLFLRESLHVSTVLGILFVFLGWLLSGKTKNAAECDIFSPKDKSDKNKLIIADPSSIDQTKEP